MVATEPISPSSPQPYYKASAEPAGPQPCEVCGGKVSELRRGRCYACYQRWADARPVGYGARCVCCGERRRQVLRTVEFHAAWRPMCFNCAGQMYALLSMPPTVEALKKALNRERRGSDRRADRPDTRVFRFERRVGERRDVAAAETYELIDDDMVIEVFPEIGGDAGDFEGEEHTRIHNALAQGSETGMPGVDTRGQAGSHLPLNLSQAGSESRHPFEATIVVSLQ